MVDGGIWEIRVYGSSRYRLCLLDDRGFTIFTTKITNRTNLFCGFDWYNVDSGIWEIRVYGVYGVYGSSRYRLRPLDDRGGLRFSQRN